MDPGTQVLLALLAIGLTALTGSGLRWVMGLLRPPRGGAPAAIEAKLLSFGGAVGVEGTTRCELNGLSTLVTSIGGGRLLVQISGPDPALRLRATREDSLPQAGSGDVFFDQRWRIESDLHEALPLLRHEARRALEALARDPRVLELVAREGLLEARISEGADPQGAGELLDRLAQVAGLLRPAPEPAGHLLEMARSDPLRAVQVEALIALASGPRSRERTTGLTEALRGTATTKALVAALVMGDLTTLGLILTELHDRSERLSSPQLSRLPMRGLDGPALRRIGIVLLSAPHSELVGFGLKLLRAVCQPGDQDLERALDAMRAPLTEMAKIELADTLEKFGSLSALPVLEAASQGLPVFGLTRERLTRAIEAIHSRHAEELEARRPEVEGAIRLAPEASGGEIKVAHAERGAVKLAPREPDNSR